MNKKLVLIVLLLSLFQLSGHGQGFNKKNRYTSIGGCLNAMNYIGDVDPGPSFLSPGIKFTRYNLGATMLYRLAPRFSMRGTFSYGRFGGSDYQNSGFSDKDIYRKIRNLSFRNQVWEFKVDAVIDLFENRGNYRKRPDYTPYMFVGLAYFHHNPQAKDPNGHWVNLHKLHTEGQGLPGGPKQYSLNQIALPIGIGFRYKLAKHLDIAFEMGWRFTTTDYLDDVGGNYYDRNALFAAYGEETLLMADRSNEAIVNHPDLAGYAPAAGGPITDANGYQTYGTYAGPGYGDSQRGDHKGRKDVYTIAGFHLTYIIPGKVICPKFR